VWRYWRVIPPDDPADTLPAYDAITADTS